MSDKEEILDNKGLSLILKHIKDKVDIITSAEVDVGVNNVDTIEGLVSIVETLKLVISEIESIIKDFE